MLKKEFEDRTGTKVSSEDFEIIHRIYMATGEMDKDTFCQNWGPKFLSNPITASMTVGAEKWINVQMSTAEKLMQAKKDLDRANGKIKDLEARNEELTEHLHKFVDAVDETLDCINLACFEALKKKFEDIFGRTRAMRMRVNHGWDLSKEEVAWLLGRVDDDDIEEEDDE